MRFQAPTSDETVSYLETGIAQRNLTNAVKAYFTYVQDEASKPKYSNSTVFAIPSRENDVRLLMAQNPDLFNVTLVGEMYDRYFEAVLGYWLTNANQSVTSSDFKTFGGLLGGAKDPTDSSSIPNYQGLKFSSKIAEITVVWKMKLTGYILEMSGNCSCILVTR